MKVLTFLFFNFVVSMIADIVLNDLTRPPLSSQFPSKSIQSLYPYFENKSILVAGVYAGLTVLIASCILVLITKKLYGWYVPTNWNQFMIMSFIAFLLGYSLDIIIEKANIFGSSLDLYYKVVGSGLWGALAFLISLFVSFLLQKYLLPLL